MSANRPESVGGKDESYGLKHQVLSPLEVLGQYIANIAPTATPTVVIPLVFAVAGGATWFAYLFALVAILLVSQSINVFAKRSASPGSFYTYIADGLGPAWGIAIGWILFISYIGVASSVTTGYTNYVNVLVKDVAGLSHDLPPLALVGILATSVLGAWFVAYKDIRLSTRLMLGIELDRPCADLVGRALAAGLLINVTAERVIRLLPPLILERPQAQQLVDSLTALIQGFLGDA